MSGTEISNTTIWSSLKDKTDWSPQC